MTRTVAGLRPPARQGSRGTTLGLALIFVVAGGCAGPAVPEGLHEEPMPPPGTNIAPEPEHPGGGSPAGTAEYRKLSENGILGGEVIFAVEGSPEDLLAMVLDFDHEAGNRPWRVKSRLLERDGDAYRVEATYDSGAGLDPTVVLVNAVEASRRGYLVRFHLETTALGLSTFSGEYEMTPLDAKRTLFREQVFIDSGLPIVNVTEEEIREALLQDASDIRKWMDARLAGRGNVAPAERRPAAMDRRR